MNLLLLGGQSHDNKAWLRDVKETLQPLFDNCFIHDYAHWASADARIDLTNELNAIRFQVRHLEPYCIFAKSAGVVLSLKGIAEKILQPAACLFVGTPLAFAEQHGHQLDVWLQALTVPTVFAQNVHDPAGSYPELERYLHNHLHSPHYQAIELPGGTHAYSDLAKLQELMTGLLSRTS